MEVMLIESRCGAGDEVAGSLAGSGCGVHRCASPEAAAAGFPCCAVVDPDNCPLAIGVDVAVLVRDAGSPQPRDAHGVACALRAGIPVIHDGSDADDESEPWLAGRIEDDVADSCRRAIDAGLEPWRQALSRDSASVLEDLPDAVNATIDWSIDLTPDRVLLVGHGPPLDRTHRGRVAVHALAMVRGTTLARDRIDVGYRSDHWNRRDV
jgi:hypothetical protein